MNVGGSSSSLHLSLFLHYALLHLLFFFLSPYVFCTVVIGLIKRHWQDAGHNDWQVKRWLN